MAGLSFWYDAAMTVGELIGELEKMDRSMKMCVLVEKLSERGERCGADVTSVMRVFVEGDSAVIETAIVEGQ
jgi:hypothetical protein